MPCLEYDRIFRVSYSVASQRKACARGSARTITRCLHGCDAKPEAGVNRGQYCRSGHAELPELQHVAVGVVEPRDQAPRLLDDMGRCECYSVRFECREFPATIVRVDRVLCRGRTKRRPAFSRRTRPDDELEVLTADPDGEKAQSVGCRAVDPLLQAEDVCVE